tara:strand:- start:6963 stop:7382 length:420 start_codon:yes stop_codon:yes gene_type:complete
MRPIDRIERIIEYYDTNISSFEKAIGASNNSIGMAIRRKSTVKDDTLNSILNVYPEISAEWLLTGKGNMISGTETDFVYHNKANKDVIEKFKDITPDEVANYLVTHFEELRKNSLIDLFIEKEVWKRHAEIGIRLPTKG